MGLSDGSIILDTNGAYYAGQNIQGRIVFYQQHAKRIHGIYIELKGICEVHWTTDSTRRDGDRDVTYRINHDSSEEYVNNKIFVYGNATGDNHLNPGRHEYKFVFQLPKSCPSSFEGAYGHVRYRIKAGMMNIGYIHGDEETQFPVRIISPLDLNTIHHAKEPVDIELTQSYCCWCISSGASEIRVRAPVSGYCPGQVVPLEASCVNHSGVNIKTVEFAFKRDIRYTASSNRDTRTDTQTLFSVTKAGVDAGTTRDWSVEIEVPITDVDNLQGCKYIKITNYLVVKTEVSGCHRGGEEKQQIVLGSVPLTGYQDYTPQYTPQANPQFTPQANPQYPLVTPQYTQDTSQYPHVTPLYTQNPQQMSTMPQVSVLPVPGVQPTANITGLVNPTIIILPENSIASDPF